MTRRRFAFWIGLCLFWVSRRLHAAAVDSMAASLMEWSEPTESKESKLERWRPNANRRWRWLERQTRINGEWKLSGVTRPVDHRTGKAYEEDSRYLETEVVPEPVQASTSAMWEKLEQGKAKSSPQFGHGQPPSRWLRSLNAHELRLWLKTISLPDVGVDGMTFWTHLTRDHSFSPSRIKGLTIAEQAKLHAAAHYGY